jgi:hypothetical protein
MTDEDRSKAQAKPSYVKMMKQKLEAERKKDKENLTRKKTKKTKMRK